jgi:hypothetical protein
MPDKNAQRIFQDSNFELVDDTKVDQAFASRAAAMWTTGAADLALRAFKD